MFARAIISFARATKGALWSLGQRSMDVCLPLFSIQRVRAFIIPSPLDPQIRKREEITKETKGVNTQHDRYIKEDITANPRLQN